MNTSKTSKQKVRGKKIARSQTVKKAAKRKKQRGNEILSNCVSRSVAGYLRDLNGEKPSNLHQMVLQQAERPLLEVVMRHSKQNQSLAAKLLGVSRNTLRKKLAEYKIGE